MTVMMLSLAGIPMTLGFIGKFYVLAVGVQAHLWWLVGAVVAGSAIGLYYYLRVAVSLYLHAPEQPSRCTIKLAVQRRRYRGADLCTVGTGAGVWPQPLISIVRLSNAADVSSQFVSQKPPTAAVFGALTLSPNNNRQRMIPCRSIRRYALISFSISSMIEAKSCPSNSSEKVTPRINLHFIESLNGKLFTQLTSIQ